MEEYHSITVNSNQKFDFIGSSSAHLDGFTEKSFIFSINWHHFEDKLTRYYEYDFDCKRIKTIIADKNTTELPFEKKISGNWYGIHRPNSDSNSQSVIEVAGQMKPLVDIVNDILFDIQDQRAVNDLKLSVAEKDTHEDNYWCCDDIEIIRCYSSIQKCTIFVVYTYDESDEHNYKSLAVAKFPGCDFTDGDSGTHVYILNGKDILFFNDGDCPSVLFLKNNSNIMPKNPISMKTAKCAEMLLRTHNEFHYRVVDYLKSFIDNLNSTNSVNDLTKFTIRYKLDYSNYYISCRNTQKHIITIEIQTDCIKFIFNERSHVIMLDNDFVESVMIQEVKTFIENALTDWCQVKE